MRKSHITAVVAVALLICATFAFANRPATNGSQNPPNAELRAKLTAARIAAVGQPLVINGTQVCGPTGDSTDDKIKELDNNRNRTDEPSANGYIPVGWDVVEDLPAPKAAEVIPHLPWEPAVPVEPAQGDFQGAPVQVIGFLHLVKAEGGESANCHLTGANEVDWQMHLMKNKQDIGGAIVVEATPRVRLGHKWTLAALQAINKDKPVRISGWLLYHSAWQIHPITKIEEQDAHGNWVNIEK